MRFDFPGNVRQLENICHWVTVMAPAQTIEAKDLPPELAVDNTGAGASLNASARAVREPVAPEVALVSAPLNAAPVAPAVQHAAATAASLSPMGTGPQWLAGLESETRSLLLAGDPQVWDTLTHKFEAQLIRTALEITRGRRIEAAQKLGIGRNTITRKIQELGLDD